MLTHLHITDFALVDHLDLELHTGLTSITGETGAGKSIVLGALGLAIGERADGDKVAANANKADIQATFDISQLPHIQKWLSDHELLEGDDCILRRVVTKEGRSRAFINGRSAALVQLKTLGEMLIDIHSQHEHQSLLSHTTHRRLLDNFGNLKKLSNPVKSAYHQWRQCQQQLAHIKNQAADMDARLQLLSYQVGELDHLDLGEGEVEQLEQEQKQLSHVESLQSHCQQLIDLCGSDQGLINQIQSALTIFKLLPTTSERLSSANELLQQALIHAQEAQGDIERELDGSDNNPERLRTIENRLSAIYDIARKHKVAPEILYQLHQQLSQELQSLEGGDEKVEQLEKELAQHLTNYQALAQKLTKARRKAGNILEKSVNDKLTQLAMGHASLSIALQHNTHTPDPQGNEQVHFLISPAPGQTAKPLHKMASGGELSRMSLAIQVITAQTTATPTLVFDEVDVGIGGTTGDEVGKMLRQLGTNSQVLCVTHLAQVASKAHNHLVVEKSVSAKGASSSLNRVNGDQVIQEIARMMGGDVHSAQSLAHAQQMLAAYH